VDPAPGEDVDVGEDVGGGEGVGAEEGAGAVTAPAVLGTVRPALIAAIATVTATAAR
jgi:hypothetical protein